MKAYSYKRAQLLFCGLAILLVCGATSCASDQHQKRNLPDATMSSDNRLFVGPVFLTGDPEIPEAKAVVVNPSGKIIAIMKDRPASTKLKVVKLRGELAMPGLHDAHMHLQGLGQQGDIVDLRNSDSVVDVVNRISQWYANNPHVNVILGRGWDQNLFMEQRMPSAADLSTLPAIPIVLTRVDGHAIWVNDAAMQLAGVEPPHPAPGNTLANETMNHVPAGIFIDNDMGLIRRVLPKPSESMIRQWLLRGLQECAKSGLVAVHDMGMSAKTYMNLLHLATEGPLPVRVFVYLDGTDPNTEQLLNEKREAPRVHLMGIKLMADGAMGSRGAALAEDYHDAPGHQGSLLIEQKILEEKIRTTHANGFQVAIHAIGDKANQIAIEAIASAQGEDSSRRHRIEHVQLLSNKDVAAFKTLHLIASMQPTHATSDMLWVEDRIGRERIKNAYAWRTLLDSGAHLAFGSDAPVENISPLEGIFAAVSRTDAKGQPPGGWLPEQRLFVNEAIDGFSSGAAYAVHQETIRGAIRSGYQFDVTLLDTDPRAEKDLWLHTLAIETWIDGEQIAR